MRFLLAGLLLIPLGLLPVRLIEATHAMPCPDVNGDGALTTVDLAILASYDGQSVLPAPAAADLDQDGNVDADDAAVIPTLIPPPGGVYTCQDTPISAAAAVGGGTTLTSVHATARLGDRWSWVVTVAGVAAISVAGGTGARMRRTRQ